MRKLLITGIMSKLQLTKKALGALALTVLMLLLNINNVKAQNVCEINGTPYASLEAAFNYACDQSSSSKTITLINNATIDATISLTNSSDLTLDMAGYDITVNADYAFESKSGNSYFTLKSGVEGSEIISADASAAKGFLTLAANDGTKNITIQNISFHGADGVNDAYSDITDGAAMIYDNNGTLSYSNNQITLTDVIMVTGGDIANGISGKSIVKFVVNCGEYTASHGFSSYAVTIGGSTITTAGYAVKAFSSSSIGRHTSSQKDTAITVSGDEDAVISAKEDSFSGSFSISETTVTATGIGAAFKADGGSITFSSYSTGPSLITSTNSDGHVLEIGESGGSITLSSKSGYESTLDARSATNPVVNYAGSTGMLTLSRAIYMGKITTFKESNSKYVRIGGAATLDVAHGGMFSYSTSDGLFESKRYGTINLDLTGVASGSRIKVVDFTGTGNCADYTDNDGNSKISIAAGDGGIEYITDTQSEDYGDVYVNVISYDNFQISDGTTTTIYATLAEAVEAVQNGQTIQLLQDVNELENVTVNSGKSFTIDLAGFTYSNTQTLTNNGTITLANAVEGAFSYQNFMNTATGSVILNSSEYMKVNDLIVNGTAIVNGGSLTVDPYQTTGLKIYGSGDNAGVVTVSNGGSFSVISVIGISSYMSVGDGNTQSGTLTVTGANTTATFNSNISLTINTNGTLNVLDHAVLTTKDMWNQGTINMDLSGAQIVNTGDSWGGQSYSGPRSITVDLTGGTSGTKYKLVDYHGTWNISLDHYGNLSATNAPEGKGAKFSIGTGADAGDLFVSIVSPVCQIGDKKYGSLEEAFGAAEDGQTITLIDNATLDYTINIDKSITLDLAGYDITVYASGRAFNIKMAEAGKSFVIKDSTATPTVRNSEIINGGSGTNLIWLQEGLTSSPTATVDISNVSVHGASDATAAYSSSHVIYDASLNVDTINLTNVSIYTNADVITGDGTTGTGGTSFAWSNLNISGSTLKSYGGRGVRFGGDSTTVSTIDKTNITTANGIAVYAFSNAEIKNSTINATGSGDAVAGSGSIYHDAHGTGTTTLTISGNTTINAKGANGVSAVSAEGRGLVVINNGTFTNENGNKNVVKVSTSGGTITVNGGNVLGLDGQVVLFTNTYAQSSPDYPSVIEVTGGMIKGGANVSSDNALVKLAGGKYQGTVNVREKGYQWVRIIDDVTLDVATGGQFQYGATYDNTSDVLLVDGYTDKIITADMTGATAASYKIIDYLGNNEKTLTDYANVVVTGEFYSKEVIDNDLYVSRPKIVIHEGGSVTYVGGSAEAFTDANYIGINKMGNFGDSVFGIETKGNVKNEGDRLSPGVRGIDAAGDGTLTITSIDGGIDITNEGVIGAIVAQKSTSTESTSNISLQNIGDINVTANYSLGHGYGFVLYDMMTKANNMFSATAKSLTVKNINNNDAYGIKGTLAGRTTDITITGAVNVTANNTAYGADLKGTLKNEEIGEATLKFGSLSVLASTTSSYGFKFNNYSAVCEITLNGDMSVSSQGNIAYGFDLELGGNVTAKGKDINITGLGCNGVHLKGWTSGSSPIAKLDLTVNDFTVTGTGNSSKYIYGIQLENANTSFTGSINNLKVEATLEGSGTNGAGANYAIYNNGGGSFKGTFGSISVTNVSGYTGPRGKAYAYGVYTKGGTVELSGKDNQAFSISAINKVLGSYAVCVEDNGLVTFNNAVTLTGDIKVVSGGIKLASAEATLSFSGSWDNAGTLTVDMTEATEDSYKIVDYTGEGSMTLASYGTVNLTLGDNKYALVVFEDDLYATKAVASITSGETTTYCATLADAIDKSADNGVITMLVDIEDNVTIPVGKTVTLDLNGKKLSSTGTIITNNGTLTLTDGIGGGNITGGTTGVKQNGTLTLSGKVNITGNGTDDNRCNLYLPSSDKTFSISNPAEGMKVGVTKYGDPSQGDIVLSENTSDYSEYFFSDNSNYSVKYDNNKLVLTNGVKVTLTATEGGEVELYVNGEYAGTSAYVTLNSTVTIKATASDGYAFKGWYDTKAPSTMVSGKFTDIYTVTKSVVLEANFTDSVIWIRVKKGN